MATKKRWYRVTREWSVLMQSVSYVEASSVDEACRLALADDDFDDQEICADSDGPTYIQQIVSGGREYMVPDKYSGAPAEAQK